ncbi:MAG: restriction endonuclease subunit S [Candidatus Paceibacterota bacterium]
MKTNLLQKNIPKGWEIKKIKDLLDFEQPTKYIVESSNYTPEGKTPVLTANKSFVLGYTNETDGVYTNTPTIIFDDFTTDSKYVDFPFKIKSSAIKILKNKDKDTNLKFVYEIMKSFDFPIANHKRHYISQYQELDIITPSIKEQRKIAEILSSVDDEIEKVDEMISKAEKLKKGLVPDLVTKGINHKKFKKTGFGNIPTEWSIKKLEDVVFFENGKAHENFIDDDGKFVVINSKFIAQNGDVIKRTNNGLKILNKGDIAVVMSDIPQGRALGKCFFVDEDNKYTLNQRIGLLRPLDAYNKYFFYVLNRNKYFLDFSNDTGQTNLRKQQVLDCPLLIPPISEQKKIAEIFDTFEEKISLNKQLKEKLFQLKKGLVLDLLSGKVRTINN